MACPVCGSSSTLDHGEQGLVVNCVRCGQYLLTGDADNSLKALEPENPQLRSLLSHSIRLRQSGTETPVVMKSLVEAVAKEKAPTPAEQRDSLILWIGSNQPSPAHSAKVNIAEVAASVGTFKELTMETESGWNWLHQQIGPERLYIVEPDGANGKFRLTMEGWRRYEEIKRLVQESRTAFMAMKFGDAQLTKLVDEHFRPAVQQTGFELHLLTDNQAAGLIDNQIRTAIRTAAFVIADLTHGNNGAYFEAGFAEGLGLHVIYTCKADVFHEKKTHFDTNHMVTLLWDPADASSAEELLKNTIRNTLPLKAKMQDE